jgi:hypothetical protein
MIRLTTLLIAAVVTIITGQADAQGTFPAPLPGGGSAPQSGSPVPQVNGMVPPALLGAPPPGSALAQACKNGFVPLRDEAERRGRLVKAASDRRAPREEACQFIGSFSEAELALVSYAEANAVKCGLQQVAARLRAGAIKTEEMYRRICAVPGV